MPTEQPAEGYSWEPQHLWQRVVAHQGTTATWFRNMDLWYKVEGLGWDTKGKADAHSRAIVHITARAKQPTDSALSP
ncbi:hypothetical protein FKM82_009764 [Ascaphus truei]